MKKIFAKLGTAIVVTGLLSCSSNSPDEPAPTVVEDNSVPTTCLPLKSRNYWDYTIENRASANSLASTAHDYLYVGNDVTLNNVIYKKMLTTAPAQGFYSSMLSNNSVRIDGTRLKVTGVFNNTILPNTNAAITLTDFVILKENAKAGDNLSSQSGQVVQTLSGFPVTIDYTMKSISDGSLATFSSNGVNYTNVKKTKIILTATGNSVIQGFPINVLSTQDIIVATLYFMPGRGMIYNHRNFNYLLNPSIAAQLQIPASSAQLQEEYLIAYDVSN